MKAIVLGSGSAYGVPVVGGDWGKCDPDNPKNRRTSPSVMIEDGDSRVLFDMSPDFRTHAEKHSIRKLDGIMFSHPHADHITGMFHLPMMMQYHSKKENLCLYANRFTRKEIEKNWWYMFEPWLNIEYYGEGRPYWCELNYGQTYKVGAFDIIPFRQHHGKIDSVGFRVGNFAYSTDCNAFPAESEEYLHGLDVWIVESDSEEETTMHSNLEQTLGWIEKYKPKKAYIGHLNRYMDYDTISAKLPDGVELCYDDLEIEF